MRRVRKLVEPSRLRVSTLNVGSLTVKLREIVDTMIRWRVNILCVQETKWKGQKAKVEDIGFKLWYTGNTSTKNDVGIVLDKSLKDGVVDIKRQEDKIILVKLLVGDLIFNVISAYAPQIGLMRVLRCSSGRSWTHWLVVCPSVRSFLEEISMGM
jgi:exonuclease III